MSRPAADAQVSGWVYQMVISSMTFVPRLQGVRVFGKQYIPLEGPVILAGNHQTNFDPFLSALGTRRFIHYMTKKELFDNPVFSKIMTAGGSFAVDRSKNDIGAIRKALEVLKGDGVLGIFPQGTRGGQEPLDGVAYLALKAKAIIIPMSILRHKGRWEIRYGVPILPEGKLKELTEKVMASIADLNKMTLEQ